MKVVFPGSPGLPHFLSLQDVYKLRSKLLLLQSELCSCQKRQSLLRAEITSPALILSAEHLVRVTDPPPWCSSLFCPFLWREAHSWPHRRLA